MVIMAALALGWAATAPCQQFFPATGQTTVYRPGDGGDIQAGEPLSYTDTGVGTIIDENTGFEWEKKSDDGSIHDKDIKITWENAFAVHVTGLNTDPCFAGQCDWRLPNIKELQSIVNYGNLSPAVSLAFDNSCASGVTVLTGSCTVAPGYYWSSTTGAGFPDRAWFVKFGNGAVKLLRAASTASGRCGGHSRSLDL